MVEQLKAKKVHWSQLEEYQQVHQDTIVAYLNRLNRKATDIPTIEAKLPDSFMELHSTITKILTDNDILPK